MHDSRGNRAIKVVTMHLPLLDRKITHTTNVRTTRWSSLFAHLTSIDLSARTSRPSGSSSGSVVSRISGPHVMSACTSFTFCLVFTSAEKEQVRVGGHEK